MLLSFSPFPVIHPVVIVSFVIFIMFLSLSNESVEALISKISMSTKVSTVNVDVRFGLQGHMEAVSAQRAHSAAI